MSPGTSNKDDPLSIINMICLCHVGSKSWRHVIGHWHEHWHIVINFITSSHGVSPFLKTRCDWKYVNTKLINLKGVRILSMMLGQIWTFFVNQSNFDLVHQREDKVKRLKSIRKTDLFENGKVYKTLFVYTSIIQTPFT